MPPLAATVSGLADVSQQSRRWHRGDRPFCPADDRIPNSVLSCHCAPRTTTLGVVWRDVADISPVKSRLGDADATAVQALQRRYALLAAWLAKDNRAPEPAPNSR